MVGFLLLNQYGGASPAVNDGPGIPPGSPFAAKSCSCSDHHGHRPPPTAHAAGFLDASQAGAVDIAGRARSHLLVPNQV